jgi:hypothetical protein
MSDIKYKKYSFYFPSTTMLMLHELVQSRDIDANDLVRELIEDEHYYSIASTEDSEWDKLPHHLQDGYKVWMYLIMALIVIASIPFVLINKIIQGVKIGLEKLNE